MVDFVRVASIVGSVLIITSGILSVLIGFHVIGPQRPVDDPATEFTSEYLNAEWTWQRKIAPYTIAQDFLSCIGSILFIPVFQALRQVFSTRSKSLTHNIMFFSFLIGVCLPALEFLQNLGSTAAADLISTWDNLQYEHLLALEISYTVSVSRSLWLFAFVFQ
eukprot:TRINITY_DN1006_c0_g2_i1.p1 TRINITY_DN1006_c0_g2~~TRINITY_DN1006_c0_g2_i1.p1  ORF type:complete len:163 (-),score=35.60 TRINITY_DN1006_c0_g2_i1:74-562(-)